MSTKTPARVATRLTALLSNDYSTQWELRAVADVPYGTAITIYDPTEREEFVITVTKRHDSPALATVGHAPDDTPLGDAVRDYPTDPRLARLREGYPSFAAERDRIYATPADVPLGEAGALDDVDEDDEP